MKSASIIFTLAFSFFSINSYSANIRTDDLCSYFSEEITFPVGDNYLVDPPKGACLRGKNITKLIAGDSEITSASLNKEGDIFFYTIGKNSDGSDDPQYDVTTIMAVFIGVNGMPIVSPVLHSGKPNWDNPEKTLLNMKVSYYDEKNSTLYFTTDAWATSAAIHALKLTSNHSVVAEKEKFFTDGDLKFVLDRGLVIGKIEHDDKGAYFPAYLYGRDGKKICQLDTRQQLWALSAPCLAEGEVLKERE
ncbi:hypothetical protein [Serratia marcescens]|uniref:hypothetical protein n=1 Tax=Serratia marcescens TaxID=615 RepID=UPI000B0D547A|nr:hypothetical protein [Serratia marcescens]